MGRKIFTFATVVSLLLCVADVWLFARHGRVVGDRHELFCIYIKSRSARYMLRADASCLALCAPPPPVPQPWSDSSSQFSVDPRPLPTLLALMRNDDMELEVMHYEEQKAGDEEVDLHPTTRYRTESFPRNNRLMTADEGLFIPRLLEAIEDPRRAVTAHYFLWARAGRSHYMALPRRPTGRFTIDFDGIKVDCGPLGEPNRGTTPGGGVDIYTASSWYVDPAQFPALRTQWHARLDRPLVAIPYSRAGAATAVMPAIWLAIWLRRTSVGRRRQRENLCPVCGYDLRASNDCCPECGTPVPLLTPKPRTGRQRSARTNNSARAHAHVS